jgi:hypothetical protein
MGLAIDFRDVPGITLTAISGQLPIAQKFRVYSISPVCPLSLSKLNSFENNPV